MASGLIALLDDVAAIAKIAAASIDDVGAAAAKAGSKAAGVVIDDAAVTPGYVTGFTPNRELPIIAKIAIGSLRNKLLILLPAAMALSAFAPWAITPLLMLGGAYLCFEGAEKLLHKMQGHHAGDASEPLALSAESVEKEKVAGAVRTDFILSAEIMAIALAELGDMTLTAQAVALAVVGIAITVAVYGVVALIVKMDDIGLHLANGQTGAGRALGRGLVKGMPKLLGALAAVGTAAMLWVGGGIIVHGLHVYHLTPIPDIVDRIQRGAGASLPSIAGAASWFAGALASAVVGLVVGGLIVAALHLMPKRAAKAGATPAHA